MELSQQLSDKKRPKQYVQSTPRVEMQLLFSEQDQPLLNSSSISELQRVLNDYFIERMSSRQSWLILNVSAILCQRTRLLKTIPSQPVPVMFDNKPAKLKIAKSRRCQSVQRKCFKLASGSVHHYQPASDVLNLQSNGPIFI